MALYVPAGFITVARTMNMTQPVGMRTSVFVVQESTALKDMSEFLTSTKSPSAQTIDEFLKTAAASRPRARDDAGEE